MAKNREDIDAEIKSATAAAKIATDISYIKQEVQAIKQFLTTFDTKYATKEEVEVIVKDVDAIKDSNKWIVRLIIGAVILAGLGLILVQKQ